MNFAGLENRSKIKNTSTDSESFRMEDMDTEGGANRSVSPNCYLGDSEAFNSLYGELDSGTSDTSGCHTTDENNEDGCNENDLKLNPLLIPNVVKEVLKNLSADDLENFRLVSTTWNMEAVTVLRSKRTVVFVDIDGVRVYNNAMKDATQFPHAQYEICFADITGFDDSMREFWDKFGPHIKKLEFRQSHLFWRDLFEVLENNVPNLQQLTLKHLPRQGLRASNVMIERHQIRSVKTLRFASLPVSSEQAVDRLTLVLQAFSHVEVIDFLPIKQAPIKSRVSSVLTDVLLKPEVILPHLKRINVKLELDSDTLEALSIKRFPFQKLQISLKESVKATSFKNMICSLQPTLVDLQITFPDSYSNFQTFLDQNKQMHPEESIQLLSKLKTLHMSNFKGSINFVQNLSQLENLEYTTNDLAKSIPFGFKRTASCATVFNKWTQDHHLKLKSLKINPLSASSPLAETLMVDSISRCFPFLNCIHIDGIDDDGLGVIYRNLPFLSEVILSEAKCTDQGLTGIPLEICNDMLETSTFIIVQAERYRRDLFIGSLQFLRKLVISSPKISDASIALGVVDCKNMRELKLSSPLISDTGIIFITDRLFRQLNLLDLTGCTEITEQSKFYAREKLRGKLEVSDTSCDSSVQSKPPVDSFLLAKPNPDRIVVLSRTSARNCRHTLPEIEFFEENSEELRDRAGMFHFHPDRRNRLRILRIREARRRNPEFMRLFEELDVEQFRRMFHAELQQGRNRNDNVDANFPDNEEEEFLQFLVGGGGDADNENNVGGLNNNAIAVPNPENRNVVEDLFDDEESVEAAAGNDVQNRPPEIHLAEILRLGLRLEDIEFWLQNRPLFEREEQIGNVLRAELRVVNLFRQDVRIQVQPINDDIINEMNEFRRVFLDALDVDVEEHPDLALEG